MHTTVKRESEKAPQQHVTVAPASSGKHKGAAAKSASAGKETKARLEARISTDVQQKIKRAAEIQGRTLTDFVVASAEEAAQKVIEQAELVRLSLADQETFAKALLHPPEPTDALRRAFARHQSRLRQE